MELLDRLIPKYKDINWMKRIDIIRKTDDQALLEEIARKEEEGIVRKYAVKKINDQSVLIDIAYNDPHWESSSEAVKKIDNQDVLIDIALASLRPALESRQQKESKTKMS